MLLLPLLNLLLTCLAIAFSAKLSVLCFNLPNESKKDNTECPCSYGALCKEASASCGVEACFLHFVLPQVSHCLHVLFHVIFL